MACRSFPQREAEHAFTASEQVECGDEDCASGGFWTPTWDNWGGGRDDSTMPWYARYDYVEAWDYNVETRDFSLRFRDDFSFFNSSIWSKTGGGFESNSSSFDV